MLDVSDAFGQMARRCVRALEYEEFSLNGKTLRGHLLLNVCPTASLPASAPVERRIVWMETTQ